VVANVSHSKSGKPLVISNEARSEVAEHFRTLRTNLQFLMPGPSEKVIMTTSSMGGEGKSFVAVNLAATIALSGKKVLLMELDLRKPRISSVLNVDNNAGFSNYVVSDIKVGDIIKPSNVHPNFYIISSGSLPPNPAELLVHDRVSLLFNEVRSQFDYVVIDCSPVGLVTDALLVSRFADMVLYVVRQRFTYKKQVNIIQGIANDRKFKKIDIIFNDVKAIPGYGYGYGYGYGGGYKYGYHYYNNEKRSFFQRLLGLKKKKTAKA
jgi:capsular exopolysaccharide synthesis family protein